MTLQFTGKEEKVDPHREFNGQVRLQMPLLVSGKDENGKVVDAPRNPASYAYVIARRMDAPQDVRPTWQNNYIFTGDGSTAGTKGDHLIVLDAQALRTLTAESEFYNGALVLPAGAWDELKAQKDSVLHLTADEVKEAQGKGYVKKEGVWTPANKTVGKFWDHLGRGRNLTTYVQLVSENSPHSESLLNVYFNPTIKDGKPTMRSWVALRIVNDSNALGSNSLNYDGGRLVGVAPEAHVACERVLEARVMEAARRGEEIELCGRLYIPVDASVASRLMKK